MTPPLILNGLINQNMDFLDNQQFSLPFSRYFQDDPIISTLILSVILFIGMNLILFVYVIYLRIKYELHQKSKAQKFAIWEQNILPLIASEMEIPPLIIDSIKKKDFELFGEFLIPYLRDTKGDYLTRLIKVLRDVGVMEWERNQLRHSTFAWRRALAIQRLAVFRDTSNVKDLIKSLHDKDQTVFLNAAGALLKYDDQELLKKVIDILLSKELLTEELFAEILLNYEESIDLNILLSEETERYPMQSRLKVIHFIQYMPTEDGATKSIDLLRNSKKTISILLEDENLSKELFSEILQNYKDPIALETLLSQKIEKYPKLSRGKIIDYIGHLKRIDGIPILINQLKKSENDEETIRLIKALGNLGSEEAIPIMVNYLKNQNPSIRAQAANSLGILNDERTAKPLSILLEDKDYWCRYYSASSISQLGDKGIEFLKSFLKKTKDPFAKDMINQFLHKLK